MKKISLFILAVIFMLSFLLTACGSNSKDDDLPSGEAQTVVIATTSDGGTVEQDAEGNRITFDSDGKVVTVEDKDGNPLDIAEFVSAHGWVEGRTDTQKVADNTSSENSSSSSVPSENDSTSADNGSVEGDLPVVIATLPEDEVLD